MINSFRFTDNVQRNISSYIKVNKYGDCCIYYTISYLWLKSKHKEYNLSYISSSRNEKQTFLFPYPLPLPPTPFIPPQNSNSNSNFLTSYLCNAMSKTCDISNNELCKIKLS